MVSEIITVLTAVWLPFSRIGSQRSWGQSHAVTGPVWAMEHSPIIMGRRHVRTMSHTSRPTAGFFSVPMAPHLQVVIYFPTKESPPVFSAHLFPHFPLGPLTSIYPLLFTSLPFSFSSFHGQPISDRHSPHPHVLSFAVPLDFFTVS